MPHTHRDHRDIRMNALIMWGTGSEGGWVNFSTCVDHKYARPWEGVGCHAPRQGGVLPLADPSTPRNIPDRLLQQSIETRFRVLLSAG